MQETDQYSVYVAGKKENWHGRSISNSEGIQYWYQAIKGCNLKERSEMHNLDFAILGYACDEGVRRNKGRVGASEGPLLTRERLGFLAFHHEGVNIGDAGDVVCNDGDLEKSQKVFSKMIQKLIENQICPIGIGGGHDIAYANFRGIYHAIKPQKGKKIGVVNFDAHFDLRPVETNANSGTPFHQILNEFHGFAEYFAIGIQRASNTKSLFEEAKKENVDYVTYGDGQFLNTLEMKSKLQSFVDQNDWIYITIDLDGFSSSFAPGVSAPSPMGFTPHEILPLLKFLLESGKVISCDLAELNPNFDQDKCTANLAARLVDFIVGNRSRLTS